MSKGGKERGADPKAPAVRRLVPGLWPRPCRVLSVVVLGSSQRCRQGRPGMEAEVLDNSLGGLWLLSTCQPIRPPIPRAPPGLPLFGHQPTPSPCPITRPQGFLAGLSPTAMPARALLPFSEVYMDRISPGVIGIIRQIAFPLSPSPPYWSAPVIPPEQGREGKESS